MELIYEAITDIGARESNQDRFLCYDTSNNYLFAVCDGLGAHQQSELAAEYFCEGLQLLMPNFISQLNEEPTAGMEAFLQAGHQWMSKKLIQKDAFDARTTCVVAYLNDRQSIFAHLGDSRLYRIQAGKITWQTVDHTMAQQMISLGEISEQDIKNNPNRNFLLKCLGTGALDRTDISVQDPLQANEALLLCSDGFWENMTEENIAELFSNGDLKASLKAYVNTAIKTIPTLDNITAILAKRLL